MLPKKHKLNLKQRANREVWQSPFQFRSQYFRAAYDFKAKQSQLGVVIAKSVFPKASDRNAMRRKIYAALGDFIIGASQLRLVVQVINPSTLELGGQQLLVLFQPLIEQINQEKEKNRSWIPPSPSSKSTDLPSILNSEFCWQCLVLTLTANIIPLAAGTLKNN